MARLVRIEVNTDVEAYPVLGIREWVEGMNTGRDLRVPVAMVARLAEAERAVEQAEDEIMRYLAERHNDIDIHEWLSEHLVDPANRGALSDDDEQCCCTAHNGRHCHRPGCHSLRDE